MASRLLTQKRDLCCLEMCQDQDLPLSAPAMLEGVLTLRDYSRCAKITIQDAMEITRPPDPLPMDLLPVFLFSQLKAQDVADSSSTWQQLSPILTFVCLHLPRTKSQDHHATLFRWRSPETHGTYAIVAFLTVRMESSVYSIDELLRLRPLNSARHFLNQVRNNRDIGESSNLGSRIAKKDQAMHDHEKTMAESPFSRISTLMEYSELIRLPAEALGPPPKYSGPSTKGSTDSDELLFRGRQGNVRPLAQLEECESEWKHNGRSADEMTDEFPSGPPDKETQKKEGFKKFVRESLSPSHLRVTAGGRIVPNPPNRGPPSPTAKRTIDKAVTDGSTASRPPAHAAAPSVAPAIGQASAGMGMGIAPAMYSTLGHGLGSTPQMPMIPVPVGYNYHAGYVMPSQAALGRAPSNGITGADQAGGGVAKNSQDTKNQSLAADNNPGPVRIFPPESGSGHVKLSPPENFDPARPYHYLNPWMAPHLAHYYGMPIAMMPPPVPNSGLSGQMLSSPALGISAMTPAYHPGSIPSQFLGPTSAPTIQMGTGSGALASGPSTSEAPHKSSIRMSAVYEKQLEGLYQSRKKAQEQLLYNKHQIDEHATRGRLHLIDTEIVNFTHKRDVAQEREAMEDLVAEGAKEGKSSGSPIHNVDMSTSSTVTETKQDLAPQNSVLRTPDHNPPKLAAQKSEDNSKKHGTKLFNDVNSARGTSSFPAPEVSVGGQEPVKKVSILPSSAALAPPFQPRVDSLSAPTDASNLSQEYRDSEIIRVIREGRQRTGEDSYPARGAIPSAQNKKPAGSNKQGNSNRNNASSGRRGKSDGESKHGYSSRDIASSSYIKSSNDESPYLRGKLRRGANPRTAKYTDYIYSRPLTEEEQRAQHLYMGKAPRSIQSGLPKFDGKDFYPASPTQNSKEANRWESANIPPRHPREDYGFSISREESDPFSNAAHSKPASDHTSSTASTDQTEVSGEVEIACVARRLVPAFASKSTDVTIGGEGTPKPLEVVKPHGPQASSESSTGSGETDPGPKWGGRRAMLLEVQARHQAREQAEARAKARAQPQARSGNSQALAAISSKAQGHGDLWQNIMKKATTSGNVLPSTVTSMTAQGFLPGSYNGHAAASLTPTINTAAMSSRSSAKGSDQAEAGTMSMPEKVGENRPPSAELPIGPIHLDNRAHIEAIAELNKLVLREHNQHGVATRSWNA